MKPVAVRRTVSTETSGMLRIRKVLAEAGYPIDGRTLSDLACLSFKTFTCCHRYLLINAGLMHVSAYERNPSRGPAVPLYSAGPLVGKPPKKPKKTTPAERSKRWKARTGYLEYQKVLRAVAKPRDKVMAALMGGQ